MSTRSAIERYADTADRSSLALRAAVASLAAHPLRAARVIELARGGASPAVIAARLRLGPGRVRDILHADRVIRGRALHVSQ